MLGVGAVFAGYQIQGVLGQGGMGTVYLAQHPRLPRQVALKLLNREVSTDPELIRRFEREADVVARLDHPGIVGVLDRGADNGHLWIAMHYIRGTDAATWDASAHPSAMAVRLLGGVASALDYAHSRGILHRDVKPANILIIEADGFRDAQAVITDFGIAGVIDSTDTKITATGTFTATLAYASPEQLSGETVDHRSDQYSLACTLFALLAGQPPYAATNPGQVVMGHLSKPVPRITATRPDLPGALDGVLEQAMAKQRDDRFPSCSAFISAALDAFGGQQVGETVNLARTAPTVHNSVPAGTAALDARGGRRSVDTVDFARIAPTVHNPAPAGLSYPPDPRQQLSAHDPAVASSAVPAPALGKPIRHEAPTTPTDLKNYPRLVLIALAMMVVIGTVALLLLNSKNGDNPSPPAWEDHQYIKDAFPRLISDRNEKGWKQVACYIGYHAERNEIDCHHHDNSGISFTIEDHSTPSAAQEYLNSDLFRGREIVSGPDIIHSAETKPAPHPELDAPSQMTVPPQQSAASIFGGAYFSFPTDPVRGRYVISVKWSGHTAEDLLREWWSQAPLER